MPEEERRISPAVVIGGAGLALGVGGVLLYALTARAAPPGLANLYGEAIDETGNPIPGTLFTLNGLSAYTDANGNCAFLELEPGPYSGSCSKSGYEVVSVTLDGIQIPFFEGGIMEDLILPEGDHQLTAVLRLVEVIPAYSVALEVSNMTPEVGEKISCWIDITNIGTAPGTPIVSFYIDGALEATRTLLPISPGETGQTYVGFSLDTPGTHILRVEADTAFDEIAIIVEEEALASLSIQATDEAGNPMEDVLFRVDSLEALTDPSGACAFIDLEFGSHPGYCYKEGYEVISIKLNDVEIPVSDGYF